MEDGCGSVNLPSELLKNVIHLVHHLLPDCTPGLDRLEALQQLKGSISATQLPVMYETGTISSCCNIAGRLNLINLVSRWSACSSNTTAGKHQANSRQPGICKAA